MCDAILYLFKVDLKHLTGKIVGEMDVENKKILLIINF